MIEFSNEGNRVAPTLKKRILVERESQILTRILGQVGFRFLFMENNYWEYSYDVNK